MLCFLNKVLVQISPSFLNSRWCIIIEYIGIVIATITIIGRYVLGTIQRGVILNEKRIVTDHIVDDCYILCHIHISQVAIQYPVR